MVSILGAARGGVSFDSSQQADSGEVPDDDILHGDDIFELLGNERRRRVLYELSRSEGPVDLPELAKRVAKHNGSRKDEKQNGNREHEDPDGDGETVSEQAYQSVYVSLYQSHLPKLAEAGILEYDRDRAQVSPTDRLAEVQALLQKNGTTGDNWSIYYLFAALLSNVLVGAAILGLSPFAAPGIASAILTSLLFSALALVHLYRTKIAGDGVSRP